MDFYERLEIPRVDFSLYRSYFNIHYLEMF